MLSHAKREQARIIGQIQKSYNNSDVLLTPTVNQIEFEKAIEKDKTPFYFEEVIKGYATDQLKAIESAEDEKAKEELMQKSDVEFAPLQRVNVVFDNVIKSFYVDVVDTVTNTFKDNEINRYFNRVGKSVK